MTDSSKFACAAGTGLIVSGGLAAAYWSGLDNMDPDSCHGAPYFWAVFSKWYLLASAICLLLILLLNNAWKHDYSKLKKTIIWLLFLPNLGTVAYVVGSFIAFHKRDECPGLHDLLVVTFWIAILICCSPAIACFLLCLSGGISAVQRCLFGERETRHSAGYYAATDVYNPGP